MVGTKDSEAQFDLDAPEPDDDVIDEAENDPPGAVTYNISSYGADYTVDSLVNRLGSGAFFVPPFQRSYVWSQPRASRFIESLLLGLPVPGIFVAKEPGSARHLIVDGQQRLKTLQFFFEGTFLERRFRLVDVDDRWINRTCAELEPDDKQRLEDSIIHTTVFKQDHPRRGDTSIHHVFERLNTGAVRLTPQEIRNCVSYGRLMGLLNDLNTFEPWRKTFGKPSARLKDQELILRFLAFYYWEPRYHRPMKDFLNEFAEEYREVEGEQAAEFRNVFQSTIELAMNALGRGAFRPERSLNAAVFDAVAVGLARRLTAGPVTDHKALQKAHEWLVKQYKEFRSAVVQATATETSVRVRIQAATEAFAKVP